MPEPLQQLRRGLLRNPGGDRVMAQVLAIVPKRAGRGAGGGGTGAGDRAALGGKVSVEHVVNVLAG
jgi:hypothetical protein